MFETAEDAGKEDAVIGAVRLGAEHADGEAIRVAGEDIFDNFGAGHAGADDDHRFATLADHHSTFGGGRSNAGKPNQSGVLGKWCTALCNQLGRLPQAVMRLEDVKTMHYCQRVEG